MLSLLFPATLGDHLQSWVNAYKEGGWVPKWPSPGYRDGMVGSFADTVLADGIIKNISGFDVATAYAAIRQNAFVVRSFKFLLRGCRHQSVVTCCDGIFNLVFSSCLNGSNRQRQVGHQQVALVVWAWMLTSSTATFPEVVRHRAALARFPRWAVRQQILFRTLRHICAKLPNSA